MGRLKTTGRPSFRPKMNNGRFKKKFKNPDKGLYGENWEETSSYVRQRDNYTCQIGRLSLGWKCGVRLAPPFHWLLHVHHIVPLPRGSNHPNNLICLCRECHGRLHNKYLGSISDRQKKAGKRMR